MKDYIERKLLSDEDIILINSLITSCEWSDGKATAPGMHTYEVKKNEEAFPSNITKSIDKILGDRLNDDAEFIINSVPFKNTSVIVSKMNENCYYNIHHDSPFNGDYSTTIFLSNPNEYVGGELCLFLNGSEKKFKLDSGYAVTYRTGIPHKVNLVESGQRICLVLWTTSCFKDPSIRKIYSNLLKIKKNITGSIHNPDAFKYDNFNVEDNDNIFILDQTMMDIQRQYFMYS